MWDEEHYTAGFPRVFYLRYHGYKFFPLWALARYRNLKRGNDRRVSVGLYGALERSGYRFAPGKRASLSIFMYPRNVKILRTVPGPAGSRGFSRI